MNELIFFIHIIVLISFILFCLRIGKEALIGALIVQIILANIFVTKQMNCFGLHVTCSEVYTIGSLFSLNLLQNYFGKKLASRAVGLVFLLLFFVIVMGVFHLRYSPSEFDTVHSAFTTILAHTPRIIVSSLFCAFLTQKIDIGLFSIFKKWLPSAPFFITFAFASLISQFIDTGMFSYLALYGIVHSMKDIILMSYLIKVVIIFSLAPFTIFIKRLIRHDPIQI